MGRIMLRIWQQITRLLFSEEGQASTEYILILALITSFLLLLVKKLIGPAFQQVTQNVSNMIQNQMFTMDMHHFTVH